MEGKVANGANKIFRNATISVPLKYSRNFWRSLEITLINCKSKLILKWTKYCVLSAADADNYNANSDNMIFTKTQSYVSPLSLWQKKTIKSNEHFLGKDLKDSLLEWVKTKNENKSTTNEYRYFLKSNFVGFNRLFVLVH